MIVSFKVFPITMVIEPVRISTLYKPGADRNVWQAQSQPFWKLSCYHTFLNILIRKSSGELFVLLSDKSIVKLFCPFMYLLNYI